MNEQSRNWLITKYKAREKISNLSTADKKSTDDEYSVISGENCHQNPDNLYGKEAEHSPLASEPDSHKCAKKPQNSIIHRRIG